MTPGPEPGDGGFGRLVSRCFRSLPTRLNGNRDDGGKRAAVVDVSRATINLQLAVWGQEL